MSAADRIDAALRERARPERAEKEKAYLKSTIEHYGCDAAALKAAVRSVGPLPRAELLATVRALWKRPVYERRAAAAQLLDRHQKLLTPDDLPLIEGILREARTWAIVDAVAVHVVGPLVEREPSLGRTLDRWAKDDDFWIRRSALLSLLLPLRKGGGDFDRFGRYATAMIDETEFFVRKAIGWVLREVSRKRPELVVAWLRPHAARASGVTFREAIKHLPARARGELVALRDRES